MGKARARERGRAEGQPVDATARVGKPLGVALEHRMPGENVVTESDRLGRLEMGEAGHHGLGLARGKVEQRAPEPPERADGRVHLAAYVQAKIGGHLVVARAAGVELLSRLSDPLGERRLDVHVNVLERRGPPEAAGFDVGLDSAKSAHDRVALGAVDDPDLCEHGGVSD